MSYFVCAGIIVGVLFESMPGILACLGFNLLFLGFIVMMDFSKDDYIFDVIAKLLAPFYEGGFGDVKLFADLLVA